MNSREHVEHEVRDTSILAYRELDSLGMGYKQRRVYNVLLNSKVPLTDREILAELKKQDPKAEFDDAAPRRYELWKKLRLVNEARKKLQDNGKWAIAWMVAKR